MALDATVTHLDFVRSGAVELLGFWVSGQLKANTYASSVVGFTRGTLELTKTNIEATKEPPLELKFKRGQLENAKVLLDRIARDESAGYMVSQTDLRDLHAMLDMSPWGQCPPSAQRLLVSRRLFAKIPLRRSPAAPRVPAPLRAPGCGDLARRCGLEHRSRKCACASSDFRKNVRTLGISRRNADEDGCHDARDRMCVHAGRRSAARGAASLRVRRAGHAFCQAHTRLATGLLEGGM
jgi:hypothetical protein